MTAMMTNKVNEWFTQKERRKAGRQARQKASRPGQASWDRTSRKYNVVDAILASEKGRVPKLLPIKHARMADTPFAFLSGSRAVDGG